MNESFYIFDGVEPSYEEGKNAAVAYWNKMHKKYARNPEKELKYFVQYMADAFVINIRRSKGKPAKTTEYKNTLTTFGDLMTVQEFKDAVKENFLIDSDGSGNVVKDNLEAEWVIYPSIVHLIPEDATHIIWFNK